MERTLRSVSVLSGPKEIIVADGGSTDRTPSVASSWARVVRSLPGRATQMNAGAAVATGEVLFFLHADTLPPPNALDAIRNALADPAVEAGAFRLTFDRLTPLLRFYAVCTRFPLPSLCFGDRGLFVRRRVFDTLGGFTAIPVFEDLDLVRRLHERGGFRFLHDYAVTSARRFERHGPLRQQLRNVYLWTRYMTGADPVRLSHLYGYTNEERG